MGYKELVKHHTVFIEDQSENQWKVVEISDLEEICETYHQAKLKLLGIANVSTRLSQMITELDNKTMNTTYDDGEHLAWDKDDIRCMQRTLQLLND